MKRRNTKASTERPAHTIALGVEVKRRDECSRGDCDSCIYKHKFEHLMSLPNCNDCGRGACSPYSFCPKPGEDVRVNCPLWEAKEEPSDGE